MNYRYKHIEGLEQRLLKMEAMIQSKNSNQAIDQAIDQDLEEANKSEPENHTGKRKASHSLPIPRSKKDAQLSIPPWKLATNSEVFSRRKFKELPSKSDAHLLVQEYFENFNSAFPLFDREAFLSTFEDRYANDEDEASSSTAWRACLNVVFALAHRFHSTASPNSQVEDSHAWGFLQNALTMVAELSILKPELLAIQAILGIVIVLQGTPNPESSSVLISTALRLAHQMRLHQQDQGPGLSDAQVEERKRVFWIAYILDKSMSLWMGDPPAQDDDDVDVDYPDGLVGLSPVGVVSFNFRIRFAIIQGKIYKDIYSTKASRRSETERSLALNELSAALKSWKERLPIDCVGGNSNLILNSLKLSSLEPIAILSFIYFDALYTIQRALHGDSRLNIESNVPAVRPQLPDTSISSDDICNSARNSIQLFLRLPQGNYAHVWLLLRHVLLASITLLSHTISNPAHTLVGEDLKLVEPVLELLNTLEGLGENVEVEKRKKALKDLWKEAKVIVEGGQVREGNNEEDLTGNDTDARDQGTMSLLDFTSRISKGKDCSNPHDWVLFASFNQRSKGP